MKKFVSTSEKDTMALAESLAASVQAGDVYCLHGDLGAGKTVFARGFAKSLGYEGRVTSPTFCLVNEYKGGRLPLYHFDAYRITANEAVEIGFEDYLSTGGVCLVEWAENLAELLPAEITRVDIVIEGDHRIICIS